ncbi:MAG: repair protein RecO [Clostridia bacterium]|nr:repair protein RecO [Clostridia bacterium]
MAGLFRADGIVLSSRDFGEADKLIRILTPRRGKIEAIAKGARKANSSLRGGTQLLAYSSFLLYDGRELATVTQCELRRSFIPLCGELGTLAHAYYLAEIADAVVMPGEPNPGMFYLLLASLSLLTRTDPEIVARAYEARTLKLMGLQPRFKKCALCGRDLKQQNKVPFAIKAGGALCPKCCRGQDKVIFMNADALAAWKRLNFFPWEKLKCLHLGPGLLRELAVVMPGYLEYQLERKLKSREFIGAIRGESCGY